VIGRCLCEQVRVNARAFAPQLFGRARSNHDEFSGGHVYMSRDAKTSSKDFLRGFGADFKKAVKQRYTAVVELHPFGESLPRPNIASQPPSSAGSLRRAAWGPTRNVRL